MTTHSSILAQRIPWTVEPGGLQSIGLRRVGHDSTHMHVFSPPQLHVKGVQKSLSHCLHTCTQPSTALMSLVKVSESHSVMSDSLRPHGLFSPWNSLGQNIGVGSLSPGDLPNPGIEPRSPTLQADALSSKPPGKPQNGYRNCLKGIVKNSSSMWDLCH